MAIIKKAICCLVIIPFLALTSGCASYKFGRLPSPYIQDHAAPVTQKDVSMAVKFLNSAEANTTFDCELTKRKVIPVYIVIDNKSDVTYSFRKADVDSSYLPAEEVARKCARSTMGRVLSYGALGLIIILWVVFIPMAIAEAINCPRINSQMRNDYITNEIADTTIAPSRSISGIMFVSPLKSGELFTIPLVNKDTGERILFQFQNTQLGTVSANVEPEKEQNKKPKQNFTP